MLVSENLVDDQLCRRGKAVWSHGKRLLIVNQHDSKIQEDFSALGYPRSPGMATGC